MDIIIREIGQLCYCSSNFKIGENISILIKNGIIRSIGKFEEFDKREKENIPYIDCKGKTVLPGFIDPHTHLLYAGERIQEFEARLKGNSYLDILKKGGGIWETVQKTRSTDSDTLKQEVKKRLSKMKEFGTTTCEIKTGYGLSIEEEQRHLLILKEIKEEERDMDIVLTYLAAHSYPKDRNKRDYLDEILEDGIKRASRYAEFCDVFVEKGVFTPREAKEILEKGKKFNLKPKLHADEFNDIGGAKLAAEIQAVSCDHMTYSNENGIRELGKNGVIPCLLPATSFFLKSDFAPARKIRENNLPVALGTDHNPGTSPFFSQLFVARIGVFLMGLSMEEALLGITLWASKAIAREKEIGSIEIGKYGDFVIFDIPDYKHLFYYPDLIPVFKTIKRGKVIYDAEDN